MMRVIVGMKKVRGLVTTSKNIFRTEFKPQWLEDDFVKQMILDVDKSEVQSPYCIMSPVLGQIPPEFLSGGTKGLILIYKLQEFRKFESLMFGDNCALWIEELSKKVDFELYMNHPLGFYSLNSVDAIGESGEELKVSRDILRYYLGKESEYGPRYDNHGNIVKEATRIW